jgi:hypothetical protein
MKTIQVMIPEHVPVTQTEMPPTIPVSIPALEDVIQLAKALHVAGEGWEGTALGWPAIDPHVPSQSNVALHAPGGGRLPWVPNCLWHR